MVQELQTHENPPLASGPDATAAGRIDREVFHDIRSMLNALSMAADLLEAGNPDVRRSAVDTVRRQTKLLSDFVEELAGTERPALSAPAETRPPPGTRVLVVEDEYLLARTVSDHLRQAACHVVGPVGNSEDALDLLQAGELDCALVDANLDGEFSTVVVEALTRRGVNAAVLSGYDRDALPAALARLPFLQKPVDARELVALVAALSLQDRPA